MGIIGSRQIKFGTASVPPIKYNESVNIDGYEKVVTVFSKLFLARFSAESEFYPDSSDRYNDYIKQTIGFLTKINALHKVSNKHLRKVKLWKERVEMPPFYEGIAVSLKSMLIKKHFPSMDKAMNEGAVYSHYSLTVVGECVEYIMEFFQSHKMFKDVDVVIKNPVVIKWVDDHNKYLEENKERLEKEEKQREDKRAKDFEEINKKLDELK